MKAKLIRFNNWRVRRRKYRLPPGSVLVLCPRCLQDSRCGQAIVNDPKECRRCGNCDVAGLVALSEEHGVRLSFVTGGEIALALVRDPLVKAVVALACEKEIILGLLRKGSKPILSVILQRPHGPCRDTRIELSGVEQAVRFFLEA